jgi:hypothetical protein
VSFVPLLVAAKELLVTVKSPKSIALLALDIVTESIVLKSCDIDGLFHPPPNIPVSFVPLLVADK